MRQHNQWKIRQLQKIFIEVCLWGLGIILSLISLILNSNIDFGFVSGAIGVVSFAASIITIVFEKYLWKCKRVQNFLLKIPFFEEYWTPVLEGRWTGKLWRDGTSHNFVIEITQSFSSISCTTYSEHSSSSAHAAEILFDENSKIYRLVYYWGGNTLSVQPNTGDTNRFEGFTNLQIVLEAGEVKKLKGAYFTDRQPEQTKGTLELVFQQKELKNAFD